MAYFGLIEREAAAAPWSFAMGDRDRECVAFERQDYRDHGAKAGNLRIVKFARVPSQRQLDARLAEINAAPVE